MTTNRVAVILSDVNLPVPVLLDQANSHDDVLSSEFEETNLIPNWVGFYDWLRASDGEVVGVRVKCDEDIFYQLISKMKGVDVVAGHVLIVWNKEKLWLDALSDDADFGGNALYRSHDGRVLVTFFPPNQASDLKVFCP